MCGSPLCEGSDEPSFLESKQLIIIIKLKLICRRGLENDETEVYLAKFRKSELNSKFVIH